MDEIVSEHILWELSLKVGHSWRDLGRCLLLDERDLYNIQMDYLPLQEGIFEMLLRWKSRNDHTATYTRLSFALMQAGRPDLGREVSTYPQSGRTLGFGKFKFEVGEMLSSHEVKRLSLYFNMPPGVMDRINRSKYPGLYFLSKLEDHGLINHTSVSRLVDALKQFGSHHTATLVEHSYQDNLPPHMGSSSHGLKDSLRSDEEISTKISAKVTDEQTEKDVSLAGSSSESTSSWIVPRLDRPVDDGTLRNLSGKISHEWKHVGHNLGLEEIQLDFIEVDHRNNIREATYQMLMMWKQRNGRDATFRVLGIALVKAGRKDLRDLVYKRAFTASALLAPSQDFEEEAELSPEMTENAESDILQSYNKLQEVVTTLLTQRDCEQLLDYFKLAKEHYEATQTSDSTSKFLLDILEERGLIHPADVSALLEALRELKINDRALHVVETYDRSKDDETSFETFLAALSAHLTLSIPEKLCDYFKFTDEEKEAVISSKSPGLALTMALERKGYINPHDVGRLLPALRELHLVQAAAKVEEYQILVEDRSDFKTPAKTLKGDLVNEDKCK